MKISYLKEKIETILSIPSFENLKTFQNIIKTLFSKQQILFLLAIMIFIILHKPIELFLTNTIVKYVLIYVESIWYNDIIFLFLIILSIIVTFLKYKKYTPSKKISQILITIILFYSFYRFFDKNWHYTQFHFFTNFKYADSLYVLGVCNLILFIKPKTILHTANINSFFKDEPLTEDEADELGYTNYATIIANKIKASNFTNSFAIGVNGKWGLGKTSFINLLRKQTKDEDIIEIDFNPWNSNSPKAIIQDFFETVQEKIRPYHSSLSRLLITYSNKLVSLNENTITKSIQNSVTALTGFESLNSLFTDINEALEKVNKKIIVYIDDLDRLDNEEIAEVLRLIRNTANFRNTFFIVAYDRNYVVNALSKINSYRQEHFLEKIFQIEITLPYFNKEIFSHKLLEKLKDKFPKEYYRTIEESILGNAYSKPKYLEEMLENMRDVTRLANTLTLNLNNLIGEVDFNDFLRLELLRLKYPSIYILLFKRTDEFFTFSKDNSYSKQKYILSESSNKIDNIKTKILEDYLNTSYRELSVPKNEIKNIVLFLDGIFGDGLIQYHFPQNPLSVVYPSNFNRYFAYNLLQGSLSEVAFSKARTLSQEEFNLKIKEWLNNGLEFDLKTKFAEIRTFDDKGDFEKIIRAIFYMANQKTLNTYTSKMDWVSYDSKDLHEKLSNSGDKLVKQFYTEKNGKENLKLFLIELFEQAQSPYTIEANFIWDVVREHSDLNNENVYFALDKRELSEISLKYFKTFCESTKVFDSEVWNLFHCCKQIHYTTNDNNSYTRNNIILDEAKSIMKKYILNTDLNSFFLAIIDPEMRNKNKFAISNVILEIFDNWPDFKTIIEQQDESKWSYLYEFKQFLNAFEKKEFKFYVDFNFKMIPIKSNGIE